MAVSHSIFASLEAKVALLADATSLQRFIAGDEVFHEGDEGQTP